MGSGIILVVDDEPQLIRLVSRYLERLGYEVVCTGNTAEAWAIIEREPRTFAMVMIDVTMAHPSGEELAWRILSSQSQAQVVLSSGYAADLANIENAFPGRVSFLQKPFSGEMLAQTAARILHAPPGAGAGPQDL